MLTGLDIAVAALILLSSLFALVRGFTREVLAIVAWAGAAYIAYRFFPTLQPIAAKHISPPWLADLSAGAGLFILALIVLSVLSHQVAARVRGSPVGALDRTLGLLFGIARGVLIACVLYGVADRLIFQEGKPDWVTRARSAALLQEGADYLVSRLPQDRLKHSLPPPARGPQPGPRPSLPAPEPKTPDGQKAARAGSAAAPTAMPATTMMDALLARLTPLSSTISYGFANLRPLRVEDER